MTLAEKDRGAYGKLMHPGASAGERRSLSSFHWLGAAPRDLRGAAEKRVAFLLLFLGAGLVLVQPCAGGSGVFTNTGSLNAARQTFTATLLPSGKVLVAGGFDNGPLAGAELYDAALGNWSLTGSLNDARDAHTATLLPNSKVLVTGGVGSSGTLTSAELYDPITGIWTPTASLTVPRYYHTATLLPNGTVLVAGGENSNGPPVSSSELYDPASETWSATGNLVTGRDVYSATLLPNGKVLAAGGFGLDGTLKSAELYDPDTGIWTSTGDLIIVHARHTATLLPTGKVLLVGANVKSPIDAELYDATTGTWSATGSLLTPRTNHTATLLPDSKVLVVAGDDDGSILASAEIYDPATGTWSATGSLHLSLRANHTATLLPDGNVLVAGGTTGHMSVSSAELYTSSITSTPTPSSTPTPTSTSTPTSTPIPTSTPTPTPTPTPNPTPRAATLGNISTRLQVGTSDRVMIAGFIVQGSFDPAPKRVLIRAAGPSLTQFGVPNALANPRLELHDSTNTIGMNDDWQTTQIGGVITSDQVAEIQSSGLAPSDPLEPALIATLPPGVYTAIMEGVNGGTGVGLVEVYDLNAASGSLLANISTRGFVQSGDNVMIGGFIVVTEPTRVIIRAIGPSLTQFGVPDALANPQLELHDATSLIAQNNDWQTTQIGGIITSDQVTEIQNSQLAPTNPAESAIIATLQPGSYTAIVRGVNNTMGNALVEVYELSAIAPPTPSPSPTPTASATPSPTPGIAKFSLLTSREMVGTGDAIMLNGFIITGPDPRRVIVRGLGPSLGLPTPLADPVIELRSSDGTVIAINDNWMDAPNRQAIIDTGLAPTNNLESAILATLNPGSYTVVLLGANNVIGNGVSDLHDLSPSASSGVTAAGTRANVLTGDNALTTGVVVQQAGDVLLRVLGGSLANAGIPNVLADPTVELRDGNGVLLAANDNWRDNQQAEIIATGLAPTDDLESAIVASLAPGAYTAVVRGKNNTTGIGYGQFYSLPHSGPVLKLTP